MTVAGFGRSMAGAVHARAILGRRVRVLAEHVAALLPGDARVLDVGCGDGQVASAIMRLRPDVAVRGIDVLVRPTAAIPVEAFDGARIPLPDAAVDAVTLVDVLHHTDDPAALLRECARVARRAVVVKDHLRDGVGAAAVLRAMDWVGNAPHGVRLPYNYLSRREWDAAFARAGLRVDTWVPRLGLYVPPVSWVCDRDLHFVARLVPA